MAQQSCLERALLARAQVFGLPMTHDTLDTVAKLYIALSIASAVAVVVDIFIRGHRQHMKIMETVWPLTMLYWGPVGLIFYYWFGRAGPASGLGHGDRPMWQATFSGASHCGAGCALGDFVGDWLAFGLSLTVFGSDLLGKILIGFVLAYLFGIVFQYFSVAPMRGLSLMKGIVTAVKIDTLSLVAYEVGMFAWMTFRAAFYPHLKPTDWAYWLMMQVAMVVGFLTTYPVNWWLIRKGIKEKM
ncbi:DUF4396 domain-containing protein [Paraburkholderia sp. DGU8]|uniref:DUF4396 domain-containing protein n=1 Tax=Paraburkholderia sp. DGU8 TaxID=3161997 RepID=UPI0034666454